MKKIKKALRVFAFVCLIVLAVFGIGLVGGVPIPISNSRKETSEANIELVESEEDESDLKQNKIKE